MNFDAERLARLDAQAVDTYERALSTVLSDPERLEALYGSDFWKGAHRTRLSVLVNTAQQILGTAGSAVILVTDEVQVEIASTGGDHNDEVDAGLCKYVVNEKHPFGVTSAQSHSLVCTSQSVTQKGLRSYLGVPLFAANGMVLGSFCVWEFHDRVWTEPDVMVLTNLAAIAAALEVQV